MKKSILLLLIILKLTFLSADKKLSYTFKTGLVVSNQEFNYSNDDINLNLKEHYGLLAGVTIGFFNTNTDFLVEVNYTSRGNSIRSNTYDIDWNYLGKKTYRSRIDYISLMTLVKFSNYSYYKLPYVIIGPGINIMLGYKTEGLGDVYKDFKKIDFGGLIGLGYDINLGNLKLLIEARYAPSFNDSYKTKYLTVKNSAFDFVTGFRF